MTRGLHANERIPSLWLGRMKTEHYSDEGKVGPPMASCNPLALVDEVGTGRLGWKMIDAVYEATLAGLRRNPSPCKRRWWRLGCPPGKGGSRVSKADAHSTYAPDIGTDAQEKYG
ncbi:hypothetical protein VNO77_20210 [Canavalia gladiata]|uniref:Uncharacterized protein n=1 Tax=Canavalia gladiata TaxID=3824 RepID=A0AAN9LPQ6_CANGL